MKLYTRFAAAAVVLGGLVSSAGAQLHWDIDTIDRSRAGGATPNGTWDVGTTPSWNINSDGSGVPGLWTDGSDAVFAAGGDATGSYTVTTSGGTITANSLAFEEGNVTISGATELDVSGTATIDVATGASASIGSVVGGASAVTKNGLGTLDLTNANLFNGFTHNAGTVRVNNNTALGAASQFVSIGDSTTLSATSSTARTLTYGYGVGGNFTLGQASGGTGALTLAGTMDLGLGVRTITVNNASDTISAVVSGPSGGIQKEGTGTLTLSGANTYGGATTVNAGILSVSNATSLGTTGGTTTITSGATLQVSGSITISDKIDVNGTGSTGSNGAIRKTGNNTTALFGQLTGSGSIIATTGTLRFTQSSSGGTNTGFTGPITATGGATIRFEFIVPNQLGQNNVITLDSGTLRNDNTGVPGNGSMFGSNQTMVLGAGGGTLMYDTAGGLSIVNPTSTISGTGGLTKTGQGNIGIAGACTYGGPTHVVAGFLKVRSSNERFPNGSALTVDSGATFDVDGLTETMGSLAGAGTLEVNGGQFKAGGDNTSTAFTGQITGTAVSPIATLTKQGTGTLTLSGNNTHTGVTAISAGAIRVQSSTALGTTAGETTVASGAALEIDGTGLTIDDPMTISGTGITSAGAVRNLANDNSMAGAFLLSGNASIRSDGGTLALSGTVKSSSTTTRNLTIGGAGNVTMSGVIGDPAATNNIGTLTKNDAGTLTLSAAAGNSYTGTTTVSGGKLLVTNTSGSGTGSGAVTVSSGATLGGTGIISGAITNNGTISPGASVGTLTASSDVIDGASSHWAVELSGASTDLLAVGGNIDLSAVDALDVTGTGTGPWVIATYAGTLTSTFDTVTSGYSVNYGSGTNSQITLSVAAAGLPGDFNSDGKVDAGDYVTWRKNNGTNNALANDNSLGTPIGPAHYALWRANFGNPPGAGSGGGLSGAAAVPEPSTVGLVAMGVIALVFRRGVEW